MAQRIVKTRLVHRKDLSTKWSSVNPILLDGEMGIEKDTRKFKIGDGVTSWNDLPYATITYEDFLAKFSVSNDENTPGTAPVRDDNNQININTLDSGDDTVAVNKGYMKKHIEQEINKISQGGKVATLGEDGKIPASQLPSYVDDIIEGYYFSQNNFFKAETFIHTPFSIGPLKTIYFNTQKYNDDNYFNYLEDTFSYGYGSYEDVLKFSSGYILRVYPGSNDVRLVAPDKTYIEILNGNNFVSYYNLPDDIGDVVEILSSTLVNNKSFQDMIGPVNFEYELAHDKNKIYLDTLENKVYRMSSSGYYVVEISSSLALGETSSTAYAGNKGKQNADNITTLQTKVKGLQAKEDSTLQTTSKTVPGAINELKQKQDTNSTNIQTNITNITKLQQDLTAANTSIASNFNRITDLEGVADEVLIELEEINEKIAQSGGSGGGGTVTVEDSFVTVNELPETTVKIPGTPTPVGESVYIENLYFNTNLSVEEVKQIILNYCEENNLYDEYGTASIGYIGGSDNTKKISITVSTTTGIYIRDNAYPSFTYYWCDEQFANSNMGNYNITRVGWQDFENPLVIDENVNAPYKPMELFSITPSGEGLNPNIKEEKIYRLFHKEEPRWVGTPIPNTGKADGFYFNISLSIEEVEKIINTLDFSNGASDHEYQVMWFNTGMTSDDIKIEKYEDGAMRITSASSGGTYWCNQKYKDNYNTSNSIQNIGWGAGSSSWNDEGYVRLSYEFYSTMYGKPVGDQNDKLSELLSLTPFEYVEGKEKLDGYYRLKNNKWIKVLEDTLVVDVETLSSKAPVPNTGFVDKVYFNTSLSDDEIKNMLSTLSYGDSGEPTILLMTSSMSKFIMVAKVGDGYAIGYGQEQMLWCDEVAFESVKDQLGLTSSGWQNFTNPIEVNEEVISESEALGFPALIGSQNDKLVDLFYVVGSWDKAKLDKIYRTPILGGVPTSGYVGKVYFNTSLSVEETVAVLETLEYVVDPMGSDNLIATIATNADISNALFVIKVPNEGYIIASIINGSNNFIFSSVSFTNGEDDEPSGWVASEFVFNDENAVGTLAPQMGVPLQNDQVANVINTSKTFSSIVGYKYHQFVNGEWKELGSGGKSENSGNGVTLIEVDQIDTINDEFWNKIVENEVVVLKIANNSESYDSKIYALKSNSMITDTGSYVIFQTTAANVIGTIVVQKNSNGDYFSNFYTSDPTDNIKSIGIENNKLVVRYDRLFDKDVDYLSEGVNIDTTTATDSDNLITSKAVRNYIAEYMSTNYGNGDTEEF